MALPEMLGMVPDVVRSLERKNVSPLPFKEEIHITARMHDSPLEGAQGSVTHSSTN